MGEQIINTIYVKFVSLSDTTRTIKITIEGRGIVMTIPKKTIYNVGDRVTLYAVPATGWKFSGFSGDVSSTVSPVTFTLN